MERYEEIRKEFADITGEIDRLEEKARNLRLEWRTAGLASVGLSVGDIVTMSIGGYKATKYVRGVYGKPGKRPMIVASSIRGDGSPHEHSSCIGYLTAKDKVEA